MLRGSGELFARLEKATADMVQPWPAAGGRLHASVQQQ